MRKLLRKLSDRHPTAIVSGRSVEKLQQWVNVRGEPAPPAASASGHRSRALRLLAVTGLYFAGSHGFEIMGPNGSSLNYTVAAQLLPEIRDALRLLHEQLRQVPGATLEDNKYALSVHTRNVSAADMPRLNELVQGVLEEQPLLRRSEGKHVIELKPQVNWNKGRAVEWLLKSMCEQMGLPSGVNDRNATAMPIYVRESPLRVRTLTFPTLIPAPRHSAGAYTVPWRRRRSSSTGAAVPCALRSDWRRRCR